MSERQTILPLPGFSVCDEVNERDGERTSPHRLAFDVAQLRRGGELRGDEETLKHSSQHVEH